MRHSEPEGFTRHPITLRFEDRTASAEAYGFAGSSGLVILEGQLLVTLDAAARRKRPDTVLLLMHPASSLSQLPLPMAMASSGMDVLCAGSRYLKNDTVLVMEKTLVDLGAYVRHARETLGYEKVVLVGWSGGGSLALTYQWQALAPSITRTAAGDPLDIRAADLQPADGIVFVAAHASRARILSEWLDPSVRDEAHPERRERELDLYDPSNPNHAPFDPGYVAHFREAQRARTARITAWVRERLETLCRRGGAEQEHPFVVHRTLADPRFLDVTLEPNGRRANWCFLGPPEVVNVAPNGLARYSSLRSWLSQWSLEDSVADGARAASRIDTALLVIENDADDAVPPSHPRSVYEAAASTDKERVVIPDATHFYLNQPAALNEALSVIQKWGEARGFGGRLG